MIYVFKAALLGACALLIASCGATTQSTSAKGKTSSLIAKTEKQQSVASISKDAASPSETSEPVEKKETVPVPRRQIPEVTVLMGKSVNEIEQIFGKPVLQRKDKPAEIWQYLTSECALHLVFYPAKEKKQSELTVHHVSMNDRKTVTEVNSKKCFGSQLRKVGEDQFQALS